MTQSIGPPSLAQGTRIAVGFSTSISRFIPACGELSKPSWALVQLDASSPLARGTQDLDRLGYVADRFIPAYAENSWRLRYSCGLVPVHPRLRGELGFYGGNAMKYIGSSPLTRGTLISFCAIRNVRRFIPAYAGNSERSRKVPHSLAVHPRLRGELIVISYISSKRTGSSPLTRGTQRLQTVPEPWTRFIPAYAGNSRSWTTCIWIRTVHPRLRGELNILGSAGNILGGSSPLTRGTLFNIFSQLGKMRFIPAYAGNSKC